MKLTFPALFAATICAMGALAADKPTKFDDMPAVVQKAMLKEAKGAKIKNTLLEVEDGTNFYEAETVLNGRTRAFLVDATVFIPTLRVGEQGVDGAINLKTVFATHPFHPHVNCTAKRISVRFR